MIARADAAAMPMKSESVDAIICSPPYNLAMDYDGVDDNLPPEEYATRVHLWALEMGRVLKPGGRAFVNVPTDSGAKERSAPHVLWHYALERHLEYRMLIVWEQYGKDAPCSWGSWMSPNAPNVRGRHEAILWFFKPPFTRGRVGKNDVTEAQFLEITKSVWSFATAPRNGIHPAPYPPELVRRCLWLSTWPGDLVLDPFVGSGTSLAVCAAMGRRGVGFDLSERYCRDIATQGRQDILPMFDEVPA